MKLNTTNKIEWSKNNHILLFVQRHRESGAKKTFPQISQLLLDQHNINISQDILRIGYNRYKGSISEDPKTLKNNY